MINDDAIVLVDEELVPDPPEGDFKVHALPLTRTAISLGNLRVTNVISLCAQKMCCESQYSVTICNLKPKVVHQEEMQFELEGNGQSEWTTAVSGAAPTEPQVDYLYAVNPQFRILFF
jgi:hypothetical protein